MKVTVNVECTPEEARSFLGLPDVQPMQEAVMDELKQQMLGNIQSMSSDSMMQTWLPAGMQGAENVQKMFWGQVQNMMSGVVDTTGAVVSVNQTDTKKQA